ncbi:MAG TPA: hypothetical protein DEQ14_11345, partial [Treponema sp.]|nr:hypothetical protein [Treponema sp.]
MKNRIFSGVFWRRFLPLVLCWVSALPLYSLPLDTGGSGTDSGSVLSRLMAISNELAFLNERLRNELGDSMRNSKELRDMLEASKRELAGMRTELEDLRSGSIVLLNTAEKSGTEL